MRHAGELSAVCFADHSLDACIRGCSLKKKKEHGEGGRWRSVDFLLLGVVLFVIMRLSHHHAVKNLTM